MTLLGFKGRSVWWESIDEIREKSKKKKAAGAGRGYGYEFKVRAVRLRKRIQIYPERRIKSKLFHLSLYRAKKYASSYTDGLLLCQRRAGQKIEAQKIQEIPENEA